MLNLMPPPTVYCWTKMSALFISHVAGWRLTKTNNLYTSCCSGSWHRHKILLQTTLRCVFFSVLSRLDSTLDSKSWTTRLVYAFWHLVTFGFQMWPNVSNYVKVKTNFWSTGDKAERRQSASVRLLELQWMGQMRWISLCPAAEQRVARHME